MKIGVVTLSFFGWLFLLVSCDEYGQEIEFKEYLKWISKESNGLVKSRAIHDISIKVKYLPTDFMVFKELNEGNNNELEKVDSLRIKFDQSIYFLMSIGVNVDEQDVLKKGVINLESYAERLLTMSFELEQYINLKINGIEVPPVLCQAENLPGLSNRRDIVIAFAPRTKQEVEKFNLQEDLDFVYRDPLFDLGINHFYFKSADLLKIPKLKL